MAPPGQNAPRAITILQVYDALVMASGRTARTVGIAELSEIQEVLVERSGRTLDRQQTHFHLRALVQHGLAYDRGRNEHVPGRPLRFSPRPFTHFKPKGSLE